MEYIKKAQLSISNIFNVGVVLAFTLILIGEIINFIFFQNYFFNLDTYDPIPLKDLIFFYVNRTGFGPVFTLSGLLILLMLPLVRILLLIYYYFKNAEFISSLISLFVLFLLLIGTGIALI